MSGFIYIFELRQACISPNSYLLVKNFAVICGSILPGDTYKLTRLVSVERF